jgi:outer membrane immunogenic protein
MLRSAISAVAIASATISYASEPQANLGAGQDWSGFYIGIAGGIGTSHYKHNTADGWQVIGDFGKNGHVASLEAGYDQVFASRFLAGAYTKLTVGKIGTSLDPMLDSLELSTRAGVDAAIRLGLLIDSSTLAYVAGGYSHQWFETGFPFAARQAENWSGGGYVLGAGIERALAGNLTWKSEYNFRDYGTKTIVAGSTFALSPSFHTFTTGISYRFGFDPSLPTPFEGPVHNWTGVHIGGSVGAGTLVNGQGAAPGGLVFVGLGYDHEIGDTIVVGASLEGRGSTMRYTVTGSGGDDSYAKADYGFDVLARVGIKLDPATLAYAVGGYSWQHYDMKSILGGMLWEKDRWFASGPTFGAGIEAAVSPLATANFEYRFASYSDRSSGPADWMEKPVTHTFRAGMKFRPF